MKLAEALQARADLNVRIQELRGRICDNALVQEGEKPQEDPKALLQNLEECLREWETLVSRINLTNCRTLCEGRTLTEQISRRDALKIRIAALREAANAASQGARRASRTEIRVLSSLEVPFLQKQADQASAELRSLDNRIQETNWTTELL